MLIYIYFVLFSCIYCINNNNNNNNNNKSLINRIIRIRNNKENIPLTPLFYQQLLFIQNNLPIEPYADIISTAAPLVIPFSYTTAAAAAGAAAGAAAAAGEAGAEGPAPAPAAAAAAATAAAANNINKGLQFTNKEYVYTLLSFSIAFGGLYLYLPFVANSPSWERSFLILSNCILVFFFFLAVFINIQIKPAIGLSVSSVFLLLTLLGTLYSLQTIGWSLIIFFGYFLLLIMIYNMTAIFFGSSYGVLGLIPYFIRLSPPIQKIIYWSINALIAGCLFSRHLKTQQEKELIYVVNKNLFSSFICAFLCLIQILFPFIYKQFIINSPFEPIGFFDLPVKFDYFAIENFTILILLLVLCISGYQVQQRRDNLPLLMQRQSTIYRGDSLLQ